MRRFLLNPARFFNVLFGTAFFGGAIHALFPGALEPVASVAVFVSLAVLVRPPPIGWFRHRAAATGLLLGALALTTSLDEAPSDRPMKAAAAPNTATERAQVGPVKAQNKVASKDTPHKKHLTPEPKTNPLQDPTKQAIWIEVTKDAVRDRLKDRSSARFRNVVFHAYQGKTPVVCGEVNGRNSFGGYSGYQGFIASGKEIVVLETDFAGGEFAKTWNKVCRR